MAKCWREQVDSKKHKDFMSFYDGGHPIKEPKNNLVKKWVYFIVILHHMYNNDFFKN